MDVTSIAREHRIALARSVQTRTVVAASLGTRQPVAVATKT